MVRKIITRANATFESLGFLQSVGENWQSTIGPNLYQALESGFIIQTLRVNALHCKRISIHSVAKSQIYDKMAINVH